MMPSFNLNICFASLTKFLLNPPSMTSSSYKMNAAITGVVLFVLLVGCKGSEPRRNLPFQESRKKLFDVFNKTFLDEGSHSKNLLKQWNQENPLYQRSDGFELYSRAWSVIERMCKDCERQTGIPRDTCTEILTDIHKKVGDGKPQDKILLHEELRNDCHQFHPVGENLTWSLVHNWYRWYCKHGVQDSLKNWTEGMKATLSYIHNEIREEGVKRKDEIQRRWKVFYPHLEIKNPTLEKYSDILEQNRFQATRNVMEKVKERYDHLFSTDKGKAKKIKRKWTPQMKTDLAYIASQLNPKDKLFGLKIKTQWDQMNHTYFYMSEDRLRERFSDLSKEGFRPTLLHVAQAKKKYDRLPPIDENYLATLMPEVTSRGARKKTVPRKFRGDPTNVVQEYRQLFTQLLETCSHHNMSGCDTGSSHSAPEHSHSDHSSEGEAPALYGNYEPELIPNPNAPTYSPTRSLGYGHTSGYEIHHFPNVSRHGKEALPPTPLTSRKSRLGEVGSSVHQEYHHPGRMQDSTDPIYFPPNLPEYGHTSGHEMHHYPNVSEHVTGSSVSSPSPREVGGSSASHEYQQPGFMQDLSAPIYSPLHFPDYESWSGYGMHISPIITEHETGTPLSTPPTPRRSRHREVPQEYHQPEIHSPRVHTEFGLPPKYSTETPSSDPVFEPQSHSPRPRRGEGSSTPRVRRRSPRE